MRRSLSHPVLLPRILLTFVLLVAGLSATTPQEPASAVRLAENHGYPELRVDGKPFFVHGAVFFYYRVPRDLWEASLEQHRTLGINTIDIPVPWNWHQPREGELDFDGRTNPRRDLRGLLRLAAEKGLRLIVRAGPVVDAGWRHGGYPDWLLEGEQTQGSAVEAERRWLTALAGELAPYGPRQRLRVTAPRNEWRRRNRPEEKEISGPLLAVLLVRRGGGGADAELRRSAEMLAAALAGRGLDVPLLLEAAAGEAAASDARGRLPLAGRWKLEGARTAREPARFTAADLAALGFTAGKLGMQPGVPPLVTALETGWVTPEDDARPREGPLENTLLGARLLLARGVAGFSYFPGQDTVTPAGYSAPGVNLHYRWDAAVDAAAGRRHRAAAVERTGYLMGLWGELLGSSHLRADFAVVYPPGALERDRLNPEDLSQLHRAVVQLDRLALLAGLSMDVVNPQAQPVEQLLRHPLLLLPVFDQNKEKFRLAPRAEAALAEYVRRGGTLAWFPQAPAGLGARLSDAMAGVERSRRPDAAVRRFWDHGQGRVAETDRDFYSWVEVERGPAENRAALEAAWGIGVLRELLELAGVNAAVIRPLTSDTAVQLLAVQRVSHAGSGPLGSRSGGSGLLSVTNLSPDEPVQDALDILSPRAGARGAGERIRLPVSLPAGESLLLPLHYSLCGEARPEEGCDDEVIAAGAELLWVERDGRTLELTFYTPARATVRLRLAERPRRVTVEESRPPALWKTEGRELEFELLRGVAPHLLRTVGIHLRYTPRVPEKPQRRSLPDRLFRYWFPEAVRLPLGDDAALPSRPVLLVLPGEKDASLTVAVENRDERSHGVDVRVEGPWEGQRGVGVRSGETRLVRLEMKPAGRAREPSSEGARQAAPLQYGRLELEMGDERYTEEVAFLLLPPGETAAYGFDFDRDGAQERVLENSALRLILSPAAGGRALAVADKVAALNLTTTSGLLRDHWHLRGEGSGSVQSTRLLDRAYRAEWAEEEGAPALALESEAGGARVRKTVRLTGDDSFEARYEVALDPATAPAGGGTFASESALPVLLRGDRTTRFCWAPPGETPQDEAPGEATECQRFVPGGPPLELPAGVTRLEVRTPGRLALGVEWDGGGRATVRMQEFSALLRLEFAVRDAATPALWRLRYRALPTP